MSDHISSSIDPAEVAGGDRCAQMRDHLEQARGLLCLANRKGVRIPSDILAAVIEADRICAANGEVPLDLETRFWHAYGILRSTIEPATRARRLYRCVFYASLALMLVCQFYFLFGGAVHKQITSLRAQSYVLSGQLQAPPATAGAVALESMEVIQRRIEQNLLDRSAYAELASKLVWLPSQQLEVSLATLEIVLEFLSTYVLPALYGLLGACAFVLRQLCDDVSNLRFADDSRVRYTLRLNIGLLAGLAVGWFISPDQDASVVANLSPLALAFVAGYGSDLLFAALDRIVNAFSAPPATAAATTEARAPAGLEQVSERQSAWRPLAVAGPGSNGKASQRGKRTNRNGAVGQPEPTPAS